MKFFQFPCFHFAPSDMINVVQMPRMFCFYVKIQFVVIRSVPCNLIEKTGHLTRRVNKIERLIVATQS